MREVEIKGIWYRIEPLDAMTQLYVARRVGPLLLNVARSAVMGAPEEVMAEAKRHLPAAEGADPAPSGASDAESAQAATGDTQALAFMKAIEMMTVVYGPFVEQLSQMKDDDLTFIIMKCLAVCRRRDGESWVPLVSSDGRALRYQDMKLGQMMTLTTAVIRDNLADFFELLSGAA